MKINYELIGKRILLKRKEKGLTQATLSEQLEISSTYLSKIERGISIPSFPTFIKICEILEISPDYLIYGTIHM